MSLKFFRSPANNSISRSRFFSHLIKLCGKISRFHIFFEGIIFFIIVPPKVQFNRHEPDITIF